MASLGRFTNALGMAHNENTLALMNMNFDFSLFRFDAPIEFQALGNNISYRRRREGELGSQHRTARRLGALFEGVLPPIPEFSRAYGRRVSEVSHSQRQNPKGNAGGGPFADHMGADGTAIWAAATSGPNAIPILLLGCMLARIWSGPEATSLWVELVDRRRREIDECCTDASTSQYVLLQAAQQEITRSNLADWDASTRAWLQTADEVKQLQQTQLMLVINNLQMPVSSNMAVYQSVIESAKVALTSMEDLLNGAAQRVENGALLLGLSAWHIYPDMIVHGPTTKPIKQHDRLVPEGSIITLGLQGSSEFNQGIYWSLPLAHLRFYGDPIQSSRSTGYDASRVSPHQLVYIALGSLFSSWFATSRDTPKGLQWLGDLSSFFDRAELQTEKDGDESPRYESLRSKIHRTGWLGMLMSTAIAMSQLSKSDHERANKLVALGHRRYRKMLGDPVYYQLPYFGLFKPWNLFPLLKTDEDRICILRNFANKEGLNGGKHIIRYRSVNLDKVSSVEFATVEPLSVEDANASSSSTLGQRTYRHKRWIALKWDYDATNDNDIRERRFLKRLRSKKFAVCRCGDNCWSICPCREFSDGCLQECSCHGKSGTCRTPVFVADDLTERADLIKTAGEDCVVEHPRLFLDLFRLHVKPKLKTSRGYVGAIGQVEPNYHVPLSNSYQQPVLIKNITRELYDDMKEFYQRMWESKKSGVNMAWHLRDGPWFDPSQNNTGPLRLNFRYGDPKTAALYSVSRPPVRVEAATDSGDVAEEELQRVFRADAIDPLNLQEYLATLGVTNRGHDNCVEVTNPGYGHCVVSLKALASIITVYRSLPGATVALTVAEKPLHDSSFIQIYLKAPNLVRQRLEMGEVSWYEKDKKFKQGPNPFLYELDLASKFACIALCEFGVHQIDPTVLQHVFAMSSRNSIFVAAPLLDDPGRDDKDREIRRVIGNIGRAGIAMMIPPQAPRIRSAETGSWEQVNHAPFDGNPEDCFQNTSLHLSFTQYTLPIDTGTHGAQDTETFLIESPISIYDRERWVADVDVLGLFQSKHFSRYHTDCAHPEDGKHYSGLITIDNWEELLDREEFHSVVRAYKNPQARLATAIISARQGHHTVVVSGGACWSCIRKSFEKSATFIQ